MNSAITVIVPAHNPNPERLRSTLLGLRSQTLDDGSWELLLVDNASKTFPDEAWLAQSAPMRMRVLKEPLLGLSAARRRGLREAKGEFAVLVDDDNVLEPDYLDQTLASFAKHPRVGVAGGKSLPRFDTQPPEWAREFLPLLALRDLGNEEMISNGLRPSAAMRNQYPAFAPIGAGMALRRDAWECWLAAPADGPPDRRGTELSSGGDNDIVLRAMRAGWEVGYFPQLVLTHIIPEGRLEADYLSRLNRGIQVSWMQVLTRYEANPWPPLSRTGALLRKMKAWFAYRAWSSPGARIRWNGACGQFEGRAASLK
jgi:glycosyltransferase involved in cell wall biosynthesis